MSQPLTPKRRDISTETRTNEDISPKGITQKKKRQKKENTNKIEVKVVLDRTASGADQGDGQPKENTEKTSDDGQEVAVNCQHGRQRGPEAIYKKRSSESITPITAREICTLVSCFLHQEEVSSVINGKFGDILKKGQILREDQRALQKTMATLHRIFLFENPSHNVSKAQFFKLKQFLPAKSHIQRNICLQKHKNIGLKMKKLYQLGVIETPQETWYMCVVMMTCPACTGQLLEFP